MGRASADAGSLSSALNLVVAQLPSFAQALEPGCVFSPVGLESAS